jgi:hypothetical protein
MNTNRDVVKQLIGVELYSGLGYSSCRSGRLEKIANANPNYLMRLWEKFKNWIAGYYNSFKRNRVQSSIESGYGSLPRESQKWVQTLSELSPAARRAVSRELIGMDRADLAQLVARSNDFKFDGQGNYTGSRELLNFIGDQGVGNMFDKPLEGATPWTNAKGHNSAYTLKNMDDSDIRGAAIGDLTKSVKNVRRQLPDSDYNLLADQAGVGSVPRWIDRNLKVKKPMSIGNTLGTAAGAVRKYW